MTRWQGRNRGRNPLQRAGHRGFTLVELMVVVVIVGILATIGVVLLVRHQKAARTYETLAMVQSIRVAQERWRSENLTYLNVSANDSFDPTGAGGVWFPHTPIGAEGTKRVSFLQAAASFDRQGEKWIMLNPTSNPLVYGGYKTNAGIGAQAMKIPTYNPPGFTWRSSHDPWYTIEAIMDSDGDNTLATYIASSLNGEIYRQNEGE